MGRGMGKGFVVIGMDIPKNCFQCPLDRGEYRSEQNPFIACPYGILEYSKVSVDRRPYYCKLKELEDEKK